MIARSFRPVGWVAAVGAAALGCYMLSLRVAAERADLDRLDSRIVAAAQQIRSLQTELGTRGRMQQLEEWNDEVLALAAPVSGQFVETGVSLARFDIRQPQIAPAAEARLASAEIPAASPTAPASAMPAPQRAVASATPAAAAPAPAPAQPPLVRRASLTVPPAAKQQAVPPAPPRARTATAEDPRRARTVAAEPPRRTRTAAAEPPRPRAATPAPRQRPAGLLDDRTLRDLSSTSRSERGGGTGN